VVPGRGISVRVEGAFYFEKSNQMTLWLVRAGVGSFDRDVNDAVAGVESWRKILFPAERRDGRVWGLEVGFASARGVNERRQVVFADSGPAVRGGGERAE
jgi:hypothetical protein